MFLLDASYNTHYGIHTLNGLTKRKTQTFLA